MAAIAEGHPGEAIALVDQGVPTTYGELADEVARVRGGLLGLGLQVGDRVALVCENNRQFVVGYLAIVGAGCVAVPLNPESPPVEVNHQRTTTGTTITVGADDIVRLSRSAPAPMVDRDDGDLAVLAFTAGTAGAPRAAMLTHGNLRTNIRQAQAVPGRAVVADDVCLAVVPLFHIFGLNVVLGLSLSAGASVVLVDRFEPHATLDVVRRQRCTVVAGAPPMWAAWAAIDADASAFASVRLALSGAAPLPAGVADAMRERFGVELEEGYGLTEASPVVTAFGRPVPGVAVRLVDPDGDDVPLGDPGEVWVRGPNVFAGYWHDPDATGAVLTADGWLRTGDVGIATDDGELRLVDRIKDLVIVSGFNVFPAEVEAALARHPAVAAACVVGVPDGHTGEAVKAFVVSRAPIEADALRAFCGERLARYKCPTDIAFVDELPSSPAGKVLRRQLRGAD